MSFFSHPVGQELHTEQNVGLLRRTFMGSCPHHILHNLINGSYKRHRFCTAEPFTNAQCKYGSHARPHQWGWHIEAPRLASGVVVPLAFGLFGRVGSSELTIGCPDCDDDECVEIACTSCGMAFDGERSYEADDAAYTAAARRTLGEVGEDGGEYEEGEEEGDEEAGDEAGEEEEEGEDEQEEAEEYQEEGQWQDKWPQGEEWAEPEESEPLAEAPGWEPDAPAPAAPAAPAAPPAKRARTELEQSSSEEAVDAEIAEKRRELALLAKQKQLAVLQAEVALLRQ